MKDYSYTEEKQIVIIYMIDTTPASIIASLDPINLRGLVRPTVGNVDFWLCF